MPACWYNWYSPCTHKACKRLTVYSSYEPGHVIVTAGLNWLSFKICSLRAWWWHLYSLTCFLVGSLPSMQAPWFSWYDAWFLHEKFLLDAILAFSRHAISRLAHSFLILRMCSSILRLLKFLDCTEHMHFVGNSNLRVRSVWLAGSQRIYWLLACCRDLVLNPTNIQVYAMLHTAHGI